MSADPAAVRRPPSTTEAGQRAPYEIMHVTTVPSTLLAFLPGQIGYMKRRGFTVSAVSSPGEELDHFSLEESVDVQGIVMPRSITPLHDIAALGSLVWYLRVRQPAIIHAHTPKAGLLGMMAGALAGTPVRVYHLAGLPMMTAEGPKRALLKGCEMLACRLAHRVIAESPSLLETAIDEGICDAAKIGVIVNGSVNGVDAAGRFNPTTKSPLVRRQVRTRFGIPQDARVVGFVGRIVTDKGIVELAHAWRTLRAACSDAHLLLVGPVEKQDHAPEAEAMLRPDPRVHFAGMDWDTPPLYTAMDVFVLPTYREGLGTVSLEAAAMGLPVVATRVTGCVDAVQDGITGTLVPAKNVPALALAIETYLKDPSLRERHGRAGRRRMLREFKPETIWESLYVEYCRLLRTRHLPIPSPRQDWTEERRTVAQ